MNTSDWLLSGEGSSLAGGIAHVCPVSEEDRMAAAKADLEMSTLSGPVFISCHSGNLQVKCKAIHFEKHICLKQDTVT